MSTAPARRAERSPGSVRAGLVGLVATVIVTGCHGPQSALDPAGRDAERIAELFWWMAGGAALVWLAVVGLTVYVVVRPRKHEGRTADLLILGGGVVVPTVVLAVLLGFGLGTLKTVLEPAPEGGLRVHVSGEQWWWRVRYEPTSGGPVVTANEIRLPVGQRVDFHLDSPDVIHSFWIPALGGKMDMIPGRTTRLSLEPTRPGVFRGACAEYCGTSHTWMAFDAVVESEEDFERWLVAQRAPARSPSTPAARRGAELFAALGCGACHSVRGTAADGVVGPDLTHVASRRTLGAGVLANGPDAIRRWLESTAATKPGVHMPSFGMLPPHDLDDLATYLEGLG